MQPHDLTTIQSLAESFRSVDVVGNAVYNALWRKGKIKYSDSERKTVPDLIDELNTRIATSAITQRAKTLIVFPDHKEQRGPLLFSTALVLDHLRRRQLPAQTLKPVLYFGATIGIRQHLNNVHINKLSLGTVFPQSNLGRANKPQKGTERNSDINLPTVLTIYSPSDPADLCERYKPSWIAIDCIDKNQLIWIDHLLAYAKDQALPVIAWTTSPLSNLIEIFQANDTAVIFWPQLEEVPHRDVFLLEGLGQIFATRSPIDIQPIVVESEDDNTLGQLLIDSYRQLAKLTKLINTNRTRLRLEQTSISLAWRILRIIESMPVPLELYEAESKNIWGMSNLSDLLGVLRSYLSNLQTLSTTAQNDFQAIYNTLQSAHRYFQEQTPPLWNTLVDMCVDPITQKGRTFVFSSISAKNLFGLALLSYYNITEDDLIELGVRLTSLKQLYEDMTQQSFATSSLDTEFQDTLEFILVGLPSHHYTAFMTPLLKQDFTVILFDYQLGILERKLKEWGQKLFPSPSVNVKSVEIALGAFSKDRILSDTQENSRVVHRLSTPIYRSVNSESNSHRTKVRPYVSLSQEYDVVQELTYLMQDEDPKDVDYSSASHHSPHLIGLMVDPAWEIYFSNGMRILFATDDKVNVIANKDGKMTTDERFVSSLRSGDKILYISGQSRQSLFELLVSRVYDNPAISLHVKLVERWHEELVKAHHHRERVDHSWSIEKLFDEMRLRGTTISDTQPLRNWLRGDTLRPQDQEDLRRLAEIFNLEFVKQHYKRIHKAGGRLHGLHVSLSRRLNSWLQDGMPDLFDTSGYEDMIDEELGLTLHDFMNSVIILTVKSKDKTPGPFPRDILGQLEASSGEVQ